jgi:putative ABC transport system permease protein
VIGTKVRDDLNMPKNPVGEFLRIGNDWFKVVGVMEKRGDILGFSQDNNIFIPFDVGRAMTGNNTQPFMSVNFTVADIEQVEPVRERAKRAIRAAHKIKPGADDDFRIEAADSFVKQFEEFTGMATAVMAGIVSISLLVGGIGIMNIMLVSVTERTREIGIRMAIGASRGAVRLQFLLEALMLSLVGCLAGVLIGTGIALFVSGFLPFPTVITPLSVIISFAISAAIGIFFGWWPATRAAKLSPIEALRS